MSEELKKGSQDQELNYQYRTAMYSLEEIHKSKIIEDAEEAGLTAKPLWGPFK